MTIVLYEGDNRDHLRAMIERGELVDSVVCDPPYGLTSVVKRFGKEGAAPARKERNDGSFARLSAGFMGQAWDGTAIERDPEFWQLVWQVMKPGAYIVAFSSSRTYHHMAVAIEAAGFITHPMIGWLFASGFPKAHNAARAIDQALGLEGSKNVVGNPVRRLRPGADQNKDGSWEKLEDRSYQPGDYIPASAEADEWSGWHYGGQVRKPALEPTYVGQKPFSEKNGALNILKHGVGAVNVDGCRVPFANDEDERETKAKNRHADFGSGPRENAVYGADKRDRGLNGNYDPPGRWPANLILDGSEEVAALFPNGSERYFESYPFDGEPGFYSPKAGKSDRAGSDHPTVKPIALMRALIRHVTPPGGTVLDPFAGSGTTGEAARLEGVSCILMEREPAYVDFLRNRFPATSHPQARAPIRGVGFNSLPKVARAIRSG